MTQQPGQLTEEWCENFFEQRDRALSWVPLSHYDEVQKPVEQGISMLLSHIDALAGELETLRRERDDARNLAVKALDEIEEANERRLKDLRKWQAAEARVRELEAERDEAIKQRDAVMAMVQAERPPEEVFAYFRKLHGLSVGRPDTEDPGADATEPVEPLDLATTEALKAHGIRLPDWRPDTEEDG